MSISSLLGSSSSSSTPSSIAAASGKKESLVPPPRIGNTSPPQQTGLVPPNSNLTTHANKDSRAIPSSLRSYPRPNNTGSSKKNSTRYTQTSSEQSKAPIVFSELVHASIKYLPRHRLGTFIYEPFSDPFLPRFEGKENSLVNVKIPRRLLSRTLNENVAKRKVWGTEIYTDDSDVVAALYHNGFIPTTMCSETGGLPEDAKCAEKKTTSVAGLSVNLKDNTNKEYDFGVKSATDGPTPRSVDADGDCLVTLLILPRLKLYRGTFRNGYNSRSWLTKHDGVSFAIHEVKFIPRGDIESTYSLRKRRIDAWEDEWQDAEAEYMSVKNFKTELLCEVPTSGSGLEKLAK